jgi:hypothetical protein
MFVFPFAFSGCSFNGARRVPDGLRPTNSLNGTKLAYRNTMTGA